MQTIMHGRLYDSATATPISSIQTIEGVGHNKHYHEETLYKQGDADWFLVTVEHDLFRSEPYHYTHHMTSYEVVEWAKMYMEREQLEEVFGDRED